MGEWLKGKKTYIGAFLLAAGAAGGYWFDVFDLATATAVLGAATAAVGLGDKGNRILQYLETIKKK